MRRLFSESWTSRAYAEAKRSDKCMLAQGRHSVLDPRRTGLRQKALEIVKTLPI